MMNHIQMMKRIKRSILIFICTNDENSFCAVKCPFLYLLMLAAMIGRQMVEVSRAVSYWNLFSINEERPEYGAVQP